MSLLSGWDSEQPSLGLIHSLVAPGGLPVLSPSTLVTLHGTQITARFLQVTPTLYSEHFCPAEILFSPPRPPADQMLGSLTLQAARSNLFVFAAGFFNF